MIARLILLIASVWAQDSIFTHKNRGNETVVYAT